jgi:uncharacterized protein (DUF697 family)
MAFGQSANVKVLMRILNTAKGMFGGNLAAQQTRSFKFALAGSSDNRNWAAERLGLSSDQSAHYESVGSAKQSNEPLILEIDDQARLDKTLESRVSALLQKKPDYRIAVASQCPVLRPIVIDLITKEWARTNAKRAALDSLPGIIPALDFLLPFTGAGDMVILTRNQLAMVLEIAACYNLPPDPRARLTELVPVIGSAFGWRAVARELVAFAPFGTGVVVSAGIAYAGTTAVARAVDHYYSHNGIALDLGKTTKAIAIDGFNKAKTIVGQIRPKLTSAKSGTAAA